MRVRQNRGPFGNHSLPEHALAQGDFSAIQTLVDCCGDSLVQDEAKAQQLRSDLARDIVRCGTQTTGHQEDVAALECGEQPFANGCAIRNGCLPGNAQTKREKLLTQIGEVRVGDASQQQLRSGIEDLNIHKGWGSICLGMETVLRLDRRLKAGKFTALAKGLLSRR